MQFEFYSKRRKNYVRVAVEPETNSGWSWFKSLKMTVEKELDNIREDISVYFNDDIVQTRGRLPKHEDKDVQEKIEKLVMIRKLNIQTRDILSELLSLNDFIICRCGGRMFKTPLNVRMEKFGSSYIILDNLHGQSVKYTYDCESCNRYIGEEVYNITKQRKEWREKLLKSGYNWVPNDLGIWHKVDDGKPLNKHPDARDKKEECDHAWERKFEYIKIEETKNVFTKITEVCRRCNKVKHIK